MANRRDRARLAAETVAISQSGHYVAPSGQRVSIKDDVERAMAASVLITPEEGPALYQRARERLAARTYQTQFDVCKEATFAAARRLSSASPRVAALNFASAKNPGGGFLGGSQAQEESLARASALVACLQRHPSYYAANRRTASLLYTDHLIVSP